MRRRRTRAWQLLTTVALVLGCNPGPKNEAEDPVKGETCSHQTKCPDGYTCSNNPVIP